MECHESVIQARRLCRSKIDRRSTSRLYVRNMLIVRGSIKSMLSVSFGPTVFCADIDSSAKAKNAPKWLQKWSTMRCFRARSHVHLHGGWRPFSFCTLCLLQYSIATGMCVPSQVIYMPPLSISRVLCQWVAPLGPLRPSRACGCCGCCSYANI
jgi:hypothetical protein